MTVLDIKIVISTANQPAASCIQGGRRQGRSLKIRRTPRRGAAGRDGIATEKKLQEGFRWAPTLPPSLGLIAHSETQKIIEIPERKKSVVSFTMASFLNPGGHPKSSKAFKNAVPELPRTPSKNKLEIHRLFGALKPLKRCWRLHGSFILTFATNLEIAPKRRPKNFLPAPFRHQSA